VRALDTPFHRQPIPAVAIAIGAGIVASKANANAAKSIGLPTLLFSTLLALLLAALVG
jgi:hypothetical protein